MLLLGTLSAQKALPRVRDQKRELQELLKGKKEQSRQIEDFSLRANREKLRLLPDLGGIHVSHNFRP